MLIACVQLRLLENTLILKVKINTVCFGYFSDICYTFNIVYLYCGLSFL